MSGPPKVAIKRKDSQCTFWIKSAKTGSNSADIHFNGAMCIILRHFFKIPASAASIFTRKIYAPAPRWELSPPKSLHFRQESFSGQLNSVHTLSRLRLVHVFNCAVEFDPEEWTKLGRKSSENGPASTKSLERAIAAILVFLQISSPLPYLNWSSWCISPAGAVLYSPDTKVPRTGELALRKAIPANTNMKAMQESLEDISYLLRIPQRKPYGTMEGDVKKALKIAVDEKESILSNVPTGLREKGSVLHASLVDEKGRLRTLLESIKEQDPDKVSLNLASSLDTVAEIELLQYPRLTGRAIVEFTIERGDGSTFSAASGGERRKLATIQPYLQVVLDGYSAPLTAGNFAKLELEVFFQVIDGAYDGVKLNLVNQAVLSDGGPQNSGFSVPLEIMPAGQFEPLYKTTLSVQDGELPVLPLSVYGAVAMAHSEVSEEYSSPYQFFFYLYDKRSVTLTSFFSPMGFVRYTTVGREILPEIKTGDFIRSAKLPRDVSHLLASNRAQTQEGQQIAGERKRSKPLEYEVVGDRFQNVERSGKNCGPPIPVIKYRQYSELQTAENTFPKTWVLSARMRSASKKLITRAEWEKRLNDAKIRKEDMNKLVMNFLVTEGYVEAAEKFRMESGTEPDIDLATITDRMAVKMAVQCGNVEDAIEKVNDLNPEILDTNPQLFFHLQQQRLIELIRNGKVEEALEFAQEELAPRGEENPNFLEELERTIALLAFEDVSNCPVGDLLGISQRLKTASEVNAAILTSQSHEKVLVVGMFMIT
ncbi:hypothetical protein ACLOJK_039360 [Asimina triloba]